MLNRIIIMLALLGSFAVPVAYAGVAPVASQVAPAQAQVYFPWVGPHGALPTGAQCAQAVPRTGVEYRPENTTANNTVPTAAQLVNFHAAPMNFIGGPPASDFRTVDGNYKGTTDQIIRWAACKWGIDENWLRAEAVMQSTMSAYMTADTRITPAECEAGDWNGWNAEYGYCFETYGMMGNKAWSFNGMPYFETSNSFDVDFRAAYLRSCINGDITYLDGPAQTPGYPAYPNGTASQMELGCIGDATGDWYGADAINEIGGDEGLIAGAPWLTNVPNPAKLSITWPLQNATVSGTVTVAIAQPSGAHPQPDPNNCYACLSIDGQDQRSCSADGPWTWNTLAQAVEYGEVEGKPALNGPHAIQVDSYTCSGSKEYHAAVNVTVQN